MTTRVDAGDDLQLLLDAATAVIKSQTCSLSVIQRRVRVGFVKAQRLILLLDDQPPDLHGVSRSHRRASTLHRSIRMTDKTALGDPLREQKLQAAVRFEAGEPIPQVSRDLGIGYTTVYGWHAKWRAGGIERLTRWRWTHPDEPLNQQEREVLEGLMLGDGCLSMNGHAKNPYLNITRTADDLEYLRWTEGVFKSRLVKSSLRVREIHDRRTGKTYRTGQLRTRSDPAFLRERERWYPDGTKMLPADLCLSPLVIAVWLADDGSVTEASRRSPEIKFATHGFAEYEVRRLAGLLQGRYEGRFPVYEESQSGQFTIRAFGPPAKALLREIDPVFPPLNRKSRRWRESELLHDRPTSPSCPRCGSSFVYRGTRSPRGVQQYKCQACRRGFTESYVQASRDPRQRGSTA